MRKVFCVIILVTGLVGTIIWLASLVFNFYDGRTQSVVAPAQPYQELIKMFEYDWSAPLDLAEDSAGEDDGAMVHDVTYASPRGGRVTATLVTPLTKGREVGLIFAHGAGGRRGIFCPKLCFLQKPGRFRC